MIERYKVLDLWPCGKSELIIFGLNESEEKNSVKANGDDGQPTSFTAEKSKKKTPTLVSPDISQLTPFKVGIFLVKSNLSFSIKCICLSIYFFQPSFNWIPGEHRVPGGTFPMPPLAADFCARLPPPRCYQGMLVE